MKIDSYQVGFDVKHQSLGFDYRRVNVSETKTSLENGKATSTKKVRAPKEDIYSIDATISTKIQAAMLKKMQGSREEGVLHSVTAEYESLDFKTKAIIQAEGKELSIDIQANLKRSFVKHEKINLQKGNLHDPLIIALDGNMPQLGKKTFEFDIDSDGKSDQISTLRYNTGFLALDKNENGKIDNGTELFGTQSGNGFKDLQAYDDDKNGWIDENDKIFDKLRIWEKTDGGDKLVGLGEVGIGAIFLGNANTEFSMKSLEDNSLKGQMRNSGFFVFEDGKAGLMSQVDLAVLNKDDSTDEKLKSFKEGLDKLEGMGIYGNNSNKTNSTNETKGDSVVDKLKAKINALKAKLSKADTKDAGAIQAQIVSLQAQLMMFMRMGLSSLS